MGVPGTDGVVPIQLEREEGGALGSSEVAEGRLESSVSAVSATGGAEPRDADLGASF